MAFNVTSHIATSAVSNDSAPWTTGSFTPTADSLLVVAADVEHQSANGDPLTIDDSVGLTWTLRESGGHDDQWGGEHAVWTAPVGGSPVSMTVEVDYAGNGSTWPGIQVFDITGHDVDTPIADSSTIFEQFGGGDSQVQTITLSGAPTSGELVIGIFMAQNDVSGTFAEPSGFTVLSNLSDTSVHSMVVYRDDTTDDEIACTDLGEDIWWSFGTGLVIAAASGGPALETSGVLNGGGSISATVVSNRDLDVTLNGGGSIAATVVHKADTSSTLHGGGSIAATVVKTAIADVTLNGGGSIAATFHQRQSVAVELNGGGSISPSVQHDGAIAATLHGGGSISESHAKAVERTGILNGGGSIAVTVTSVREATPTLNGGGSIAATAVGEEAREVAAELNGGGSIAAALSHDGATTAVLNGGGSITHASTGHHILRAFPDLGEGLQGPALNGGGSVTAAVTQGVDKTTSGVLNGGGSLNPVVTTARSVAVTLNGGGSIAATTVRDIEHEASAILHGGGSIAATIENHVGAVAAELNGGGSIPATVSGAHILRAFPDLGEGLMGPALHGGGSIAAAVQQLGPGEVAGILNGGGSITATTIQPYVELALDPASDPESSIDHELFIRYAHSTGNQSDTVNYQLRSGSTVIVTGTLSTDSVSYLEFSHLLSAGEADSITDYGDMSVRFWMASDAIDPIYISDVWFVLPEPAPIEVQGILNGGGSITARIGFHPTIAVTLHGGGSIAAFIGRPHFLRPGGKANPRHIGGSVNPNSTSGKAHSSNAGGRAVSGSTSGRAKW